MWPPLPIQPSVSRRVKPLKRSSKCLKHIGGKWGVPVGVLSDSGSANLSESVRRYMKDMGIESVTAGPRNPKGNGTDGGCFQPYEKRCWGKSVSMSHPLRPWPKSVLETIVSVYIHMRNRLCLRGRSEQPVRHMREPLLAERTGCLSAFASKIIWRQRSTGKEDQVKARSPPLGDWPLRPEANTR